MENGFRGVLDGWVDAVPNKLSVEQAKSGNSIPRNPILQSMAAKQLPYRGIGTGIPRALKAYPHIEFFDDPDANRFRSVILRPRSTASP
ncbi:MAG: hypothetical protein ACO3JG_11735 [Luteolibacter sp.]